MLLINDDNKIEKIQKMVERTRLTLMFCLQLIHSSISLLPHSLHLDNVTNGDDWGSHMNLFHYQLFQ
jgi:hypothetical protein